MDNRDHELIVKLSAEDAELRALYSDHVAFDKLIEKLEAKAYLNPTEEMEIKELKKKKLAGKTRIMSILDTYRKSEAK